MIDGGGGSGERPPGDSSGGEGGGARGVSLSPTPVSSLLTTATSSGDDTRSLFKWSCDLAVTGGDGSGHVSSSSSTAEEASLAPSVEESSVEDLVQQWNAAEGVLAASAPSSASVDPRDVASIDNETKTGETNGQGGDEGGRGPFEAEKSLNLDLFRCPVRPNNTHIIY